MRGLLIVLLMLGISGTAFSAQYLGCFKDNSNRDVSGYFFTSNNMNTQLCVSECRKRGFSIASTQYGSQCFCGNSYGKYGSANNCNMACAGNGSQICGGTWANSVFKTGRSHKNMGQKKIMNVMHMGCYKDNGNRDINGYHFSNAGMSKQMCVNECSKRGFMYAATQYSSHCFCGNSYGRYGQASNCNMKCSGNNRENCGGSWANWVYQIR